MRHNHSTDYRHTEILINYYNILCMLLVIQNHTYLWDGPLFIITSSLKIQNQQILEKLFFVRHLSIVKTQHLSAVYLTTLSCNLKLYFHFILPRKSRKGKFPKPQSFINGIIAQSKWRQILNGKIVVCFCNIQHCLKLKRIVWFLWNLYQQLYLCLWLYIGLFCPWIFVSFFQFCANASLRKSI